MAARPAVAPHVPYPLRGVGPFTHKEPRNWPAEIFGGINTFAEIVGRGRSLRFGAGPAFSGTARPAPSEAGSAGVSA
jgi:hypothetical protein